ncbi:hypothetical protein BDZ94DRAFT_1267888 [Collybia nuda]|uniref:Uncharacterized protein n=1 Tax=Collybia nuda TaxID=64659 RepID=A0A9P6CG51_9AGAR|nr:hypothetical protein BDZ94DRAFT_1267888 [Collybia nuda]
MSTPAIFGDLPILVPVLTWGALIYTGRVGRLMFLSSCRFNIEPSGDATHRPTWSFCIVRLGQDHVLV